jgi:hypothetical protein
MRLSSMASAALQEEIQLALRYGHGEPTVLQINSPPLPKRVSICRPTHC